MEFQSKESKRSKTIQLFIGYTLIAVLIGLSSLILVYLAQGYNYDTNNGVSQSGLVFIDSKPSPDMVLVDNRKVSKRTSLAEGRHEITIKKEKYRDWSKKFALEGGAVMYFSYPKLFPVDIPVGVTRVYQSTPVWVSQSPDRRWLIIQQQANSPILSVVDLSKPDDEPLSYMILASQLGIFNRSYGEIEPVEWSDDNQHLLLLQTLSNGTKNYIVIDREDSDKTVNITDRLGVNNSSSVVLRDKKYDKYYTLDSANKILKTADLKNGLAQNITLGGVVSFKSYADNLIIYVTYEAASVNEAKVFVLSGEKDKYMLSSLPRNANNKYLLDLATYDGSWYYTTASTQDKFVYIYRNPLKRDKPGNLQPIKSQMSLSLDSPQYVSFSKNARFIGMQAGKNFVVYDGEQSRVYRYQSPLGIAPTQQAEWMDGHRYTVVTDSKIQVFEFDGTNQQTLISSHPKFGAYFDRDYKYVFSLITQADGKIGFENGQLILN